MVLLNGLDNLPTTVYEANGQTEVEHDVEWLAKYAECFPVCEKRNHCLSEDREAEMEHNDASEEFSTLKSFWVKLKLDHLKESVMNQWKRRRNARQRDSEQNPTHYYRALRK